MKIAFVVFALLAPVGPLAAQQPIAPPGPSRPIPTTPSRPSPLGYFARSLLVPGWGQASLDRKLTGGLFIAFEGIALGMMLKANTELRYLERTGSARVEDKRNERQDWLVLIGANHLFAGLEAFVAANLYDFPGDLRARPLSDGRTGLGLQFSLPR
ncbi:MAG TPA: hypothetical protein VFN22_13475 [Gemmatimonadales bacterium]|nr:hypothetical protein [Gemmatimonadales bacterium]